MSLLQKHTTIASGEVSALGHVWDTSGYLRFIYGTYLILSIVFYGIGIFTALDIFKRVLNEGTFLTLGTALFLCYVLLNTIVGYGFMFYRKWLLIAFSSALILMWLSATFFSISDATSRAAVLLTSTFIIASILGFLFLTRRLLSGKYLALEAVIPFVALLSFSLLLTNFDVLH